MTGDAWTIDEKLVRDMIISDHKHQTLTFQDVAKVRIKREKLLPTGKLDWAHNRIALGEACLVIGVWGLGGEGDFEKVCGGRSICPNLWVYNRFRAERGLP